MGTLSHQEGTLGGQTDPGAVTAASSRDSREWIPEGPTGQANLAIYLGALVLRHYGGVQLHGVIAVAALSTVT